MVLHLTIGAQKFVLYLCQATILQSKVAVEGSIGEAYESGCDYERTSGCKDARREALCW